MSAEVVTYAADQEDLVPKPAGVGGEVKRSSAQIFRRTNYVPQDLANADDAQSSTSK